MQDIEQKLNYRFKNKNLLRQALTHASLTGNIHKNYERLEFLGDRVLGVTIAEMLCTTFPNEPEGDLAQRFVTLVCKETVAEVVLALGLDKDIRAQDAGVIKKTNVLCDVGEAIIAAIYLDSQDIKEAQNFIKRNWESLIDRASSPHKDYKTALQEKAAALKLAAPVYTVINKTGPEHEPVYTVEVTINGYAAAGSGKGKKTAEQKAAEALYNLLDKKQ